MATTPTAHPLGKHDSPSWFYPDEDAAEADLLHYRDRQINRWSLYRNSHLSRIALSIWYFLGRQWASLDIESMYDGARGAILRDMDDGDWDRPRPVTNEIDIAVEQELVALVGARWTPKCTPTSRDPAIKAAAQISQDGLNYRLKQLQWPEKRRQLGLNFAVAGTALLCSEFDRPYTKLHAIGAPTAVWCQQCQTKLYSRDVPTDMIRAGINGNPVAFADSADVNPPTGEIADVETARLAHCPTCSDAHDLVPYKPSPREASEGDDIFGRPLGVMEPSGNTSLEVDLPFEFYPQDGGLRVSPSTMKRWGRQKIRDMEWIEERYPDLVDMLDPDPVSDLLYDDPLMGMWAALSGWSPRLDSGILDHHKNVQQLVSLPNYRHPLGRYTVAVKEMVLETGPLLQKATVMNEHGDQEEVYVPRIHQSIARYKIRVNEIWGTTISDHAFSPINRRNGIDAMAIETRLRMGPYIWMPQGMWIEGAAMEISGIGKVLLTQPDPSDPETKKPETWMGPEVPESWFIERDRCSDDIRRILGPTDAGAGNNPTGVGNTSQLQLLIEQNEKSRGVRQNDLIENCVGSAFTHMQQMQWVLGADNEEVYRTLGPDKSWSYEKYKGTALRGQTEIEIEQAPYVPHSVLEREATREALTDQVITIDSPLSRRRIAEKYGLPADLSEDTNNQVDQAERDWVDFRDHGLVPVQDFVDDASIRYDVLQSHLMTEEGRKLTKEMEWNDILPIISGWQEELVRANRLEEASIQFYGGRLEGEAGAKAYAQARLNYDKMMQLYQQQVQVMAKLKATPAPVDPVTGAPQPSPADTMQPPMKPQAPPPPVSLPTLLQARIALIWSNMMRTKGYEPPVGLTNESGAVKLEQYIALRSLVEAYRVTVSGLPQLPEPMPPPELAAGGTMAGDEASMPGANGNGNGVAPGPAGPAAMEQTGIGPNPPQPPNTAAVASMPEGGAH